MLPRRPPNEPVDERAFVRLVRTHLEPDGSGGDRPLVQTFPGIGYRVELPTEQP